MRARASLDLQAARVAFVRDPATAPALQQSRRRSSSIRKRSRSSARAASPKRAMRSASREAALATKRLRARRWKAAVDALPADHVDPLTLPLVAALARLRAARTASAMPRSTLLQGYIDARHARASARRITARALHLSSPKRVGAIAQAMRSPSSTRRDAAFAELPATHPWRARRRGAAAAQAHRRPRSGDSAPCASTLRAPRHQPSLEGALSEVTRRGDRLCRGSPPRPIRRSRRRLP